MEVTFGDIGLTIAVILNSLRLDTPNKDMIGSYRLNTQHIALLINEYVYS